MGTITPGPWKWFGNGQSYLYLATTHSGRRIVMDFVRKGFNNAQPRFQPPGGLMVKADDLLQFAVGNQSIVGMDAAKKDGSVYRFDIRGIDCADARLIAAAPELFERLKEAIGMSEKTQSIEDWINDCRCLIQQIENETFTKGKEL